MSSPSQYFLLFSLGICLSVAACNPAATPNSTAALTLPPPNILWITNEDISPNLGCYGDAYASTPNLDQLASEGVLYTHAFGSAPVCAVARSSIISGMFSPSIGTQHMRCKGRLPEGANLYPTFLRKAGYYCTNNVKTDYNLDMDPTSIWDESSKKAHWRGREDPEQPFFAIFNFTSSHESRVNDADRYADAVSILNPEILRKAGEVPLPPYYPDTKDVQELWSRYYNIITAMDQEVGEVLAQLKEDGLEDNTIIIYYSDHGAGIPRHKRWLYDSGLRVPLIVKVPEKYKAWLPHKPGTKTDELVSFIDFPATALHLAGISVPDYFQGRPFLGQNLTPPRKYIYAGRDRMDERYDMQRAVRSKRYKYICYYEAYQPFCQYMNTPEKGAIMRAIRQAALEGSLPAAGQHIVAPVKPREELFDVDNDPYELTNLAARPEHQTLLQEMRSAHAVWSDRIKDTGLIPETILRQWETEQDASIYDIMRRQSIPVAEIRETAVGEKTIDQLQKALSHSNEAVRYWAAINLGNRASEVNNLASLHAALLDDVPVVRIAAARALCKLDTQEGIPVLTHALAHEDSWVRLAAAQVLDEIGEQARSAIPALQSVMEDDNKYVVRVANHALNLLLGTANIVR
ncbi:MAG: sulfatase-like hydrolase/transferase [Bacteroidota bacterium]